MPTQSEINNAKAYLKKRLNAEQSMSKNLEDELAHFARKLVALLKEFNISDPLGVVAVNNKKLQEAINKLVKELIDTLIEDVDLLSEAAEDGDKNFIIPFIHGERYGTTLNSRIDFWVNKYKDQVLNDVHENGVASIINNSINFGAGYGINRLLRHTIALAWMQSLLENNKKATGFYSFRGSSYPCDVCDDYTGYHPISEYMLPLHPNCCCYAVFVYE